MSDVDGMTFPCPLATSHSTRSYDQWRGGAHPRRATHAWPSLGRNCGGAAYL